MGSLITRKKGIALFSLLLAFILYWLYTLYFTLEQEDWSMEGVAVYQGKEIPDVKKLTPDDFPREMENLIRAIDQWYALKERKGIDTNALKEEFLPRTKKIERVQDFFEIGLELFSRLQNGHSQMLAPSFGLPIQATLIEGRPIITAVREDHLPEGVLEDIDLEGMIIEKIDSIPAKEWLEGRRHYISSSNADWYIHGAVEEIFLRYVFEEDIRTYKLRDRRGEIKEIQLNLDLPRNHVRVALEPPEVEFNAYEGTGYIAINSLADGVVEQFDAALEELQSKGRLVLDLRKCIGGDSRIADEIFRRLIQSETNVWTGVKNGERVASPFQDLNYSGELTFLIGPHTFSAGEGLAFDLYDAGRGLFVGSSTRGCSGGGPRLFLTDGGFMFRFPTRGVDYSASGLEMEGEGLSPDIEVEQTLEEYLAGIDTVLQYALQEIKSR